MPNTECAQLVFRLLDQFRACSGLKVNYTETEGTWIGSLRDSIATPLGLTWCKSVKALAIVFTYNANIQLQKNFYDKLKDIRTQTRLWSCRGLSLYGKVTIIKSFLLPKMLQIFSVLPTPVEFIKQLNIIYNFLWKGPDKIARLATINDIKYGGLSLVDLESSIKSLRLAWLGRLFAVGSSPWKAFAVNYLLKDFGGRFLFKCNYDVNEYDINSIFYKELLQW